MLTLFWTWGACLDLNMIKLVRIILPIKHTQAGCVLHLKTTPVVCCIAHPVCVWLKEELDKMETMIIVHKVTEPTEWINASVAVEKPKARKTQGMP